MDSLPDDDRKARRFLMIVAAYLVAQLAVFGTVHRAFDVDEAEQVLLAQWWQTGYSDQPPLYTWIQIPLFRLFGVGHLAIGILKTVLLYWTAACVFRVTRRVAGSVTMAVLATTAILALPDISWHSQRDITHTILAMAVAAATLDVLVALDLKRTTGRYLWLGFLLGAGALAKSNYFLFLLPMVAAMLTTARGRAVVLRPAVLGAVLIGAVMTTPYAIWAAQHPAAAFAKVAKFHIAEHVDRLLPLRRLAQAYFWFAAPAILVLAIFFPRGFLPSLRTRAKATDAGRPFPPLGLYVALLTVVLMTLVTAWNVTNVKPRWLQPMLFLIPIWFFVPLRPEALGRRMTRAFLIIAAIVAVIMPVLHYVRLTTPLIDVRAVHAYPYDLVAREATARSFHGGVVLGSEREHAGNLLFELPGTSAYDPRLPLPEPAAVAGRPILIFWEGAESAVPPPRLLQALVAIRPGAVVDPASIVALHLPLHRAPDQMVEPRFAIVP